MRRWSETLKTKTALYILWNLKIIISYSVLSFKNKLYKIRILLEI